MFDARCASFQCRATNGEARINSSRATSTRAVIFYHDLQKYHACRSLASKWHDKHNTGNKALIDHACGLNTSEEKKGWLTEKNTKQICPQRELFWQGKKTSERAVLAAVLAELRLCQIDISSELELLSDMELRAVMFDQKLLRYDLPNLHCYWGWCLQNQASSVANWWNWNTAHVTSALKNSATPV